MEDEIDLIYNKGIESYDVDSAKDLLNNIKMLSNLPNLQVPKLNGDGLTKYQLKEGIKDYIKLIEYSRGGYEKWPIDIILLIDNNCNIIVSRCEEGIRKLLNILDKHKKVIEIYQEKIKQQNDTIQKYFLESVDNNIAMGKLAVLKTKDISPEEMNTNVAEILKPIKKRFGLNPELLPK